MADSNSSSSESSDIDFPTKRNKLKPAQRKSSKSEEDGDIVCTPSTNRKTAKSSEGKDVGDQDGDASSQPVISKTFLKDMIKEIMLENKVFSLEEKRQTHKAPVSRYSGPE